MMQNNSMQKWCKNEIESLASTPKMSLAYVIWVLIVMKHNA